MNKKQIEITCITMILVLYLFIYTKMKYILTDASWAAFVNILIYGRYCLNITLDSKLTTSVGIGYRVYIILNWALCMINLQHGRRVEGGGWRILALFNLLLANRHACGATLL